ncbi:LacI family DNA-binding transcriptional regulator [Microbacterium sp. STN6]|uniref:LacI family DNA-binding transcriptional regulator n=1 Tax=Microbacterium sp. STN6 TaxID=2995588 RepID=UPI002261000E|nr:LacI family DNA-binding transcriptional regulator [Microbacterium sp. STN6]MCX7522575.1 LacI family DNA-binding transcriptional regulator [Microbacterium sp. STN6]
MKQNEADAGAVAPTPAGSRASAPPATAAAPRASAPRRAAAQHPTISDVAHAAGVSKGLVSLTLNDRPGVAQQTRDRINAAAEQLGWRPNPGARGLTMRRAYSLGFVLRRDPITFEVDPFFAAFVAGVEQVLSARGQVLVISMVHDQEAEIGTYRRLHTDNRVDGFLITDLLGHDPRIDLVSELGSAAVTLGRPSTPSPFPAITRDYDRGIRDLVGHLVSLGHHRIAHVAGDGRMQHAHGRMERYVQVARDLGIEPLIEPSDFSPEAGAKATRRLLDRPEPPTAIVYANDPMAVAGIAVAHERGLQLPADLSIAGMDGADLGRYVYPTLTTLDNDPLGWGRAAATTLLALIDDGSAPDLTLPPAALIRRNSTAAPRTIRSTRTTSTTSNKET